MTQCGYRTGLVLDDSRQDWDATGPRPIAWSAWYPTAATEAAAPGHPLFDTGPVLRDASPRGGAHPVVLLSHGTGGIAESLGWIARELALAGHVVIGANHHGNTGLEPYRAEGFLCWWERARDLTLLLSELSRAGALAGHLDMGRVAALGFSLGGYSALALAGGRTRMEAFQRWADTQGGGMTGPREFPDLWAQMPRLMQSSEVFRRSWAAHGDDYCDPRIRRVVTMAPAPGVRGFTPSSIRAVTVPVTILSAGSDSEAPVAQCGDWLAEQNPGFDHINLGPHVGHYTFLCPPMPGAAEAAPDLFTDHASIDRRAVHARCRELVLAALG
ncbi:Dienelactone hydrolase [Candidatus Rhodobacter oscarellae]|uniref:Dienelactone hydrolase n=1 Tax=Candidatus Rhodobacter oscarellae TaxID=1675527 RepID=A0A0J9ECR0_9RHOB|nr:dienelactone hydrolase [Candidatus Rhodobacter lobularis]KMW60456.1 Dienelactone hydrolase [Candidatus Rhodobacter lobularis]